MQLEQNYPIVYMHKISPLHLAGMSYCIHITLMFPGLYRDRKNRKHLKPFIYNITTISKENLCFGNKRMIQYSC